MKLPRIQASKIQFFKPFFIVNYLFNALTFKHRLHSLTIFSLPPSFPSLFLLFKSVSKQLGEANLVKVQRGISGSQPQCLATTNDTHTSRGDVSVLSQNIYFLSSPNYQRLLKREPGEVYWRQNKSENWINYLENSGCSPFCLAIKEKKKKRERRHSEISTVYSLDWLSVVIKFLRSQLILWDTACAFSLPM